jgi:hypothetical protein
VKDSLETSADRLHAEAHGHILWRKEAAMRIQKGLIAITVAACLTFTAFTPSRARAADLPLIIGASVGAFLVVVIVGALLTTSRNAPFSSLQELPPGETDATRQVPQDRLRFGIACRPSTAGVPLACW